MNKKLKKQIDLFVEDRSLTWSTTASGSPASMNPCLIMPTYWLLFFETTIFRSSIQDGMKFCLSMEQFPLDDILESLYKFRMRESDQLKTVLEFYDMEIH